MSSKIIKNSIIAGLVGLIISFLLNYFVVPMPETVLDNAIGNAISGGVSGFMGACISLIIVLKLERDSK